ncbi:unnamed protein product [Pedinophyceae sp. YPF-701]|nr:unnamed protein product [Pedinophyceae sp. YPF-701]
MSSRGLVRRLGGPVARGRASGVRAPPARALPVPSLDLHAAASAAQHVLEHVERIAPGNTALPDVQPALAALHVQSYCFDDVVCQERADRGFLISTILLTAVGVLGSAALLGFIRFPGIDGESSGKKKGEVFSDERTGVRFQSGEAGVLPERDTKGELAFRARSYTPWPIEAGAPGERIRIDVGPVDKKRATTFVFERTVGADSALVQVTLPRPMGVVFEEDRSRSRVVVAEVVPGTNADRALKRARLNSGVVRAPMPGDVLRAFTCTTTVYTGMGTLGFGAKPPTRTVVLYGADGERWPAVSAALQKGVVADGDVTLILERGQGVVPRAPPAASEAGGAESS